MGQQIHSAIRTVTTAGTPVRLSSKKIEARWCNVQALSTNTGNIYLRGIGEPGGVEIVPTQSQFFPPMGDAPHYDLKEIHLDAAVNGEGVSLLWYAGDK